ncbi:hypothetical protein Tco_1032471 [Tanacetum coccineum]|uniref:Uncharacterized protein n=1 Tax=Tanacetum coccineum TaxID=301880 RepID=A0ABQ5GDE5_9ASTR
MSDSEHSTVTYTSVSEDDSDIGSPGVDGPPIMPEVPPSPDYIPGPEGPPSPDYVPGPEEPEQAPPSPIYIPFVPEPVFPEFLQLPVGTIADQDPYLAYRVTARMSIRHQAPTPFLSEEVAERLLALPTPPPSPLSPYSSPLPQIPFPPLPISSPPPISPTYVEGSMGSRAAGIRQRDALPVHETEMPEMCLPLRKRPCRTTPGPGYEVGESSAAGTARQAYCIRDTWDDLVGAIQEIAPTTLEGVNQRVIELIWIVIGPSNRRKPLLIEEEARLSRAAWARSMDACDQVHSEGISLRTTVMAQQSEITELQAADRRRQAVITDLLKADYRRQRQLVETLKIVKSLKAQMIEPERHRDTDKDHCEPELPEEASSSS